MILDSMEIDNLSSSNGESSSPALIEDPEVLDSFALSLYKFKQNAGENDLFGLVGDFREISTTEILKLLESHLNAGSLDEDKAMTENWLLETKFWNLVELLIGFRYSDEYSEKTNIEFDEFTSHVVIKDSILMNNNKLKELDLISYWLIHNMSLDEDDQEVNREEFPSTKWLNTKIDLQSNSRKPDLVSSLDSDSTLRNNQTNKRARKINEKDLENDDQFFQIIFKLLLEEKHDEVLELCASTNNWTLSTILAGAHDYIDPEIDGSLLKTDDDEESMMDVESAKATGIKNKLLWRRAVYLLSNNNNLGKYERAIYSFLSGDYRSMDLVSSWERQLLVLTNNILQYDLEEELIQYLKPNTLGNVLKLSKPDKKCQSINEALNLLSHSTDQSVKKQSSHSIRVLIGAIISNNVEQLVNNSIDLLDELILLNDKIRNAPVLTTKNTNNLIKESYLLRILIHFIIFMKFLNDSIISDDNLIKLIKLYITRLSLYKLYDLIPIYISYIPSHQEIVENYSFFLSNIIISQEDRLAQLKHMRTLELPLEDILKKTVERIFEDTAKYYTNNSLLELGESSVSRLDSKLIESINWFIDSKMLLECVTSTISLSRRFLVHGKLNSFVQLYESFNFVSIVNEYRIESNILREYGNSNDEDDDEDEGMTDASSLIKVEEIIQYQLLSDSIKLIDEYEKESLKDPYLKLLRKAIQSVYPLITEWLKTLVEISTESEDLDFYNMVKSLYLPHLTLKLFNIVKDSQSKVLLKEFKNLVLLISDEEYQVYKIFMETDKLSELLKIVAEISKDLLKISDNGIHD